MIRTKSSSAKTHKQLFKITKKSSLSFKKLNQRVLKSLKYIYFMRKKKKNSFKKNWIDQTNNFFKLISLNYCDLIFILKRKRILLNKKMLSQGIITNPLLYIAFIFTLIYKKSSNNLVC